MPTPTSVVAATARQNERFRTSHAIAHVTRMGRAGVVPPAVAKAICDRLGDSETIPALVNGREHAELVTQILGWSVTS